MNAAPKKIATRRAPRAVATPAPVARGPAARPKSLTAQAYERIEELIVTLELAPGTALSEAELSARLEIGRTPVREALQRLAREHLVAILPQRGVLVSEIDIKRQLRLLETRREVERLVVRCAARRCSEAERSRFEALAKEFEAAGRADDETRFMRADKEFNDLSLVASRNEFAAGAMGLMHGLSRRFWYLHYKEVADLPLAARLHADVARAIASGTAEDSARASDRLLDYIEDYTRATLDARRAGETEVSAV